MKHALQKKKFIRRVIFSERIDTFKFLLENIKWDKILPDNCSDKAYETFHFIFSDLYDTAFPKREIEIKTQHLQSPSRSRGLQKSYKRKQRLYEKFLRKEQLKMKLYIRSINIYFKRLRKNLKQVIISVN